MTQYVKITKASSSGFWYANEDLMDAIFQVKQCPDIPEDWAIVTSKLGRNILKEDCEPFQFAPLQETSETEDQIKQRVGKFYFNQGYDSGYKVGRAGSTPLQEDQHLITTDQLKKIHRRVGDVNLSSQITQQELEEWFPQVFAPAKTYKNGDRIIVGRQELEHTVVVLHVNKPMFMLLDERGEIYNHTLDVKDPEAISEEEMKEYIGDYEFTKLPDNTDQAV